MRQSPSSMDARATFRKPLAQKVLVLSLGVSVGTGLLSPALLGNPEAIASVTPVITDCSAFSNANAQYLIRNGSFEDDFFPNANDTSTTATLASLSDRATSGGTASANNGQWLRYGTPHMFLFMRDATASNANRIPFWQAARVSDGSETFIEIQRQVSDSVQDGDQRGSAYWDNFGVRAAHGNYWAELNAEQQTRLFQDITTVAGQRITYSVKHRGRYFGNNTTGTTPAHVSTTTDEQDKFKIYIGPPGGTMVEQAPTSRRAPDVIWNTADATYSAAATSFSGNNGDANEIYTRLNDGWVMYTGTYTVPAGQTTTRFQFQSEGTGTVGNFIDDVRFDPVIACPRTVTIARGVANDFDYDPMVESQIPGYTYPDTTDLVEIDGVTGNGTATFDAANERVVFQSNTVGTYTANFTIEDVNNEQSTAQITINVEAADANLPDVFLVDPTQTTLDIPSLTLSGATNAMVCLREVENIDGDDLVGSAGMTVTEDSLISGVTEDHGTNIWTYRGAIADAEDQIPELVIEGVSGNALAETESRFVEFTVTAATEFGQAACDSGDRRVFEIRPLNRRTLRSTGVSF
jgi:hypothetical protein